VDAAFGATGLPAKGFVGLGFDCAVRSDFCGWTRSGGRGAFMSSWTAQTPAATAPMTSHLNLGSARAMPPA
jgi:hypothetical protein